MANVKQKVFLMTEQQRDALLNYLLNRPYREVAGGVKFLTDAPTTVVNMELPEEESASLGAEDKSKLDAEEEFKLDKITYAAEELAVLSRT